MVARAWDRAGEVAGVAMKGHRQRSLPVMKTFCILADSRSHPDCDIILQFCRMLCLRKTR